MIHTEKLIVKTNGNLFDEFQQVISGLILQEHKPEVHVSFISSNIFEEEIQEYFNLDINFINVQDILQSKYLYNEKEQELILDTYEYGKNGYEYIVVEARNEFKKPTMTNIEYIALKSHVHKIVYGKVHDYIFPQLNMLFDTEKINVGLQYSQDVMSNIYQKCEHSDVYHYIDFTNTTSIKKNNISYFHIDSKILLFIALSMCDFIIGDIDDKVNYESSFKNMSMIHDVRKQVDETNVVHKCNIYDENCMFPNSQLLLKYI
tara:strand:- start:5986 stop:6768 length:783 start_codon:yes stop_codon:yes gene_type:complete